MKLTGHDPQRRTLVCGVTGSGKSWHVKDALARADLDQVAVVVVPDVHGEYLEGLHNWLPAAELAQGARTQKPFKIRGLFIGGLAVRPDARTPEACAEAFKLVARLLAALEPKQKTILILDEVHFWADQVPEELRNLACMGRHDEIEIVFVTQRAAKVPIDARSQCQNVVAFAQSEPADLEALRLRCGKNFAEEVSLLVPASHEHAAWTQGQPAQEIANPLPPKKKGRPRKCQKEPEVSPPSRG